MDSPFVREAGEREVEELTTGEVTRFCALVAPLVTAQRIAPTCCREMSAPAKGGMARVKRLARYLFELPRLVWNFGREMKDDGETLQAFAESE